MNLPRFALRYRSVFLALTALACAWGAISYTAMPRREDPEFTIRVCQVSVAWPGATAGDVELLVTEPLEQAIFDLDEVKEITSRSLTGYAVIYVTLEDGVGPDSVDNVWDKVRAKVRLVELPRDSGCGDPRVDSDFGDTSAMVLAVYQRPAEANAPDAPRRRTPREMEVIADRLRDDIKLLDAVGSAELIGVRPEVIYLQTDAGTWSQLSMTADELKDLLESRNIVAPGGSIDTELSRFGVKPTGEFQADAEIASLVVGAQEHRAPVVLGDLDIETVRGYEDPPSLIARYGAADVPGGAEAVVVSFTMKAGHNITALGERVRARIEEARRTWLPADVGVAVVSDQPATVAGKIDEFSENLWQAVAIVVGVALLLIGLRVALVMGAAIPLVMLATLATMPVFGVQLEQVSIAALIIALGMLVDNAIEVCDNIHRLLEEGCSRREAAARGAGEIAFPVLIATLTTVAAFLPMLTLPGSEGEYVYSLPVVVSAALLISWFLAMTTTTIMAHAVIRPGKGLSPLAWLVRAARSLVRRLLRRPAPPDAGAGGQAGGTVGRLYEALAARAVRMRAVTLAIALAAFAAAVALVASGLVGTEYFPPAARPQFVIDVDLPQGTAFDVTRSACRELEDILADERVVTVGGERVDALANFVGYVGGGGPRFYLGLDPKDPGSNRAFFVVNTTDTAAVDAYVAAVRRAARERIPGARVSPKKLEMGPPVSFPVQLRISGDDKGRLRTIADRVKAALAETEGTWDVHDSWGRQAFQVFARTDKSAANLAGVTNAAVAQTLNAYYSGHYLTTYREGDHRLGVYLRLPPEQRRSIEGIYAVHVEGRRGKVPIDAVADIDTGWVQGRIERRDLKRTIAVNARVRAGMLPNAVLAAAMPRIREIRQGLRAGYSIETGGQQKETAESQENMSRALTISVLLIVLLLVIQYNSLVKPLIILVTIPLAATGALVGLWVTGEPLGFMANLGLLSLAGVVLNDAIVLTEFVGETIRRRLASGGGRPAAGEKPCNGLSREAFRECLIAGSRMRILPIVLTTLTTVGGLMPLMFAGGPLFEPMASVIVFGLLFATALTLIVLPTVIALFVETFGVPLVDPQAPASPGPQTDGQPPQGPNPVASR